MDFRSQRPPAKFKRGDLVIAKNFYAITDGDQIALVIAESVFTETGSTMYVLLFQDGRVGHRFETELGSC